MRESSITQRSKSKNENMKKENYRSISWIKINAKNTKQIISEKNPAIYEMYNTLWPNWIYPTNTRLI